MHDESDDPRAPFHEPPTVTRIIRPLGPRVVVKMIESDERSPGGLFLPQGVAEKHDQALYGEVIEVARAEPDDEDDLGTNVSGVPAGARILFPKDKGVAVPWDPKLRVVDTKDVLAVIEETDAIM
ncbi:MAG: co-chaperone GroES [Myxococcota bacterium]